MCKANLWSAVLAAFALATTLGLSGSAVADDPKFDRKESTRDAVHEVAIYRASKLIGMKVRNTAGEDLGKIDDLVMDVDKGTVRYAAISFGGFLGLGDKLFAVPMGVLKLNHADNETYFLMHADKERLKNAPGFDKEAWPDFADPAFAKDVDEFYGTAAAEGTHKGRVVSTAEHELTMSSDGKTHSHQIGSGTRITIDGREAKLTDVRKGDEITITTEERDGQRVVTNVTGHSTTASRRR